MRVSREQAAENRKRVVETAGRLFRERGFDGIGVADLMKAAGLTHGGFYGQFASKDALAAEAVGEALKASAQRWRKRAADHPDDPRAGIVDYYLSDTHRDASATGCPIAALGGDTARQTEDVRHAYGNGLDALIDILAKTMPEETPEARRQSAIVALSAMAGAITMARAVGDPALSDEILGAARAAFARQ